MRICSMVVDNLEKVNYRVGYSSYRMQKHFDRFVWFGSDKSQCEMLEDDKEEYGLDNVDIIQTDHKIMNGMDFAHLQDVSFQFIKENYPYEVVCFLSADEFLTDFGLEYFDQWCDNSEEAFCVFLAMSSKMFCETGLDPVVFQAMRKGVKYRTNDGLSDNTRFCNGRVITVNSHYFNLGNSDEEDKNLVIDHGYIDPLACYQKMNNWNRLCYGSPQKKHLIEIWESGNKEEFIRTFFKYHRDEFHRTTDKNLVPFQFKGEYKRMIEDLRMVDDYNLVAEIAKEF